MLVQFQIFPKGKDVIIVIVILNKLVSLNSYRRLRPTVSLVSFV